VNRVTIRRIGITALTGVVAFVGSNLLQDPLDVSLGEQFILSIIVGGVTLLSQFLVEFGQRQAVFDRQLGDLAEESQVRLISAIEAQTEGLTRLNDSVEGFRAETEAVLVRLEKNSLWQQMEDSALQTDLLTTLVRRSSRITPATSDLVRDLAQHEVRRVSSLLRELADLDEVFYDGEDREYLLGLAQNASSSIVATSLVTVDAGRRSFEGGLWLNDLGARYLDIQRAAWRRGVGIRRIFVFDAPDFASDPSFVRVRRLQREAGVEIRGLDESSVPEHLKDHIVDVIVFDEVLAYETTRASRITTAVQPAIVTTRIVKETKRVKRSCERFEELWAAAQPLPSDPPEQHHEAG
jgi:hypothetical protein